MEPVLQPDGGRQITLSAVDYRALFEGAPGLFLATLPDEPNFTIAAVSDAFLRALATSREKVSGRGIFEIFREERNPTNGTTMQGLRASLEQVLKTLQPHGVRVQSHDVNHSGERYWSLLNSPVLNESGELAYIVHRFEDLVQVPRQKDLWGAERRQALLMKLLEGQRQTSDPGIMMYAAAQAVGHYLNVDRTGFFEIRKGDNLHFETGWSAGRLPLLEKEFPASWIGTDYLREVLAGRTLGISDAGTDALTADSRFAEIGTVSLIGAPIIRNGRWHAGFYVNHAEPRIWLHEEVALVREVAELTWDAIERSRAEAALKKSEERLTFALEAGDGVGAWDWDVQADLVYCSRQFAELYSVDPEWAAGGAPISAFLLGIHPGDRAQVAEKISEVLKTGRDYGEEYRVIRSDGELRWVNARGHVYRDDAGAAVRFPGIVFDVTERRKAEAEYRRQWHLFDTALSNTPDFTYIFDLEGRFTYVNRPLLELWRKPLHDAIGKNFFELEYPPELAERLQRQIREVIETRESVRDRTPFKGPSGETRYYEYIFVPVLGGTGQIEAVAGSTRDITELEQADAELRRSNMDLERANKELEEFAYVASHDLQEPLRMVNIYTHLILKQLDSSDAKLGQYAEFVRQGVKRMEVLLRDLLTFSRIEHSEEPHSGAADLSAALDEALSVLKDRIESSGAVINAEPLPIVHGETAQTAHVFQNLLSNAIKYRRKDVAPIIRISAVRDGDQWIISVKDNGIGFLPQYAERIFGLFKRLHKDEYPGTGLGLAICQRIVKRYRGRIWAGGSPGNGATFSFALPSAEGGGRAADIAG